MIIVFVSSAVDRGFEFRFGKTKNYKMGICEVCFVLDQHAKFGFLVLAHWNNSPRIDILQHLDTLSWFQAIQIVELAFNNTHSLIHLC
jgi:hypothetical protein